MAYMNFSEDSQEQRLASRVATASPAPADAVRFTPLELRIIELAEMEDVARGLSADSWWSRSVNRLFGLYLRRPFANPRLDRLHRFASLARHHPERLTEREFRAFVSAGFSEGQANGLFAHLAHRRMQPRAA